MSGTAILAVAAASYQGAAGGGGTGDFALQVETTLPVPIDWSTAVGRDSAHFDPADEPLLSKATILGLLRSPGANVSCLNPVKPAIPRLIGVTATLASREPFSVDGTTWRGLMGPGGHEVRAFGDADSVEWILHSKLGGMIRLSRPGDSDAELQIAGLTHGSFLAGDLLVPDWAFRRLYRDVQAPTLFLIAAPESLVPKLEDAVRRNLSAYGVTIKRPRDIVASLRQVQNAYLSIFLVFGVLGLALAVVGTSLVSARNVLERRREFGLALAVGQPRSRVACWMVAETVLAIAAGALAGLTLGTLGGLAERATVSWPAIFVACVAVLGAGIAGTVGVAWFSLRRSLLDALRSE